MRVYLRTFGCRANHYDGEVVRAMVEASGGRVVAAPADADVAVFNSCAVTAGAEVDLRKGIRRAARERPGLRTVVMGCAAALDAARPADRSLRALPGVTDVIPGADPAGVALALALPPGAAALSRGAQTGTRANLRIQDGCDEHCTFCATTLARGANRSRPPGELVAEAQRLADRHPEIVLTGIHIGTYGHDAGGSLGALVDRLVREVPGPRFRLSSLEATEVDERLAELLTDGGGRVCPYLHAPLQSGSDQVLRRMGRHWYTASRYADAVERVVSGRRAFGLGADVIAGFPGETSADHRRTVDLVERLPFTALHVFPFSLRPGTPAERLGGRLPAQLVAERAAELRELALRKGDAYRSARAGGTAEIVIEGTGDRRAGLTEDYLSVGLADATLPRGLRLPSRLELRESELVAVTA